MYATASGVSNPASKFPTRRHALAAAGAHQLLVGAFFSNNIRFPVCFIDDQRLDLFSEDYCWCLQNRYPKGIEKIHLLAFSVHLHCCAREGASIHAESLPDYCQSIRRTRLLAARRLARARGAQEIAAARPALESARAVAQRAAAAEERLGGAERDRAALLSALSAASAAAAAGAAVAAAPALTR